MEQISKQGRGKPTPLQRLIGFVLNRRGGWALALLGLPLLCGGFTLLTYMVFPPPALDIILMGLDSRAGEGAMSRTDSLILVGVKPSQLRVSLLSFPRDLFIDTPGYGSQRINTINMLGEEDKTGGEVLLMQAISADFDITVDRFVRVDFAGFVALIDALGGVTIDVEKALVDNAYPTADGGVMSVRFDPGVQEMDGARALIYARTRHSDDDYARAERQQQVISAVMAKLANPLRWGAAWAVIQQYAETNLNAWELLMLAPPVLLNRGRFEQLVINRDYILGTAQGHAVPNYDLLGEWVRARFE